MDDVTHSNFGEKDANVAVFFNSKNTTGRVIDSFIRLTPSMIFERILDGRNAQNEYDRNHGHLFAKGTNGRNPIEKHDKEEIQIGETMELF